MITEATIGYGSGMEDWPLQTPVTSLDMDRHPWRILDMNLAMADPCPHCGAFRMCVGDWVCLGHCWPCEERDREYQNQQERDWIESQQP